MTREAAIQIALLLLVGAAVFGLLAFRGWYRKQSWQRPAISGAVMGLLSTGVFVFAFTVAIDAPSYPVPFTARFASNPTPNTPETIAAGRVIYNRFCLVCHGAQGRGDGPAAMTLKPRPLDLNIHVPLHAPGEHFHWISEGIPGTAMPGWKTQLSETERWQTVRYLYALIGRPQP